MVLRRQGLIVPFVLLVMLVGGNTAVSLADQPAVEESTSLATLVPESVADLEKLERRVAAVIEKATKATVCIEVGGSSGSGVIISEDGYVLTAGHVAMRPGLPVTFIFADGKRVRGKTLGINVGIDSGLMKITDQGPWPHMEMGAAGAIEPGTWVIAMGHPGGFDRERSVVSRLGRVIASRSSVIQTDCTIIGGDSGGPLFDLDGKVVGIHSRISNSLRGNYHVPITPYVQEWDRLASGVMWNRPLARGEVAAGGPYIGVQGEDGFAQGRGASLARVYAGTPASDAGLRPGDVVVEFNRQPVGSFGDLSDLVRKLKPGDQSPIVVERDGERVELQITIGRANEAE